MIAFCNASGVIKFRPKLPAKALPIASGDLKTLRLVISQLARHALDGKTLLVPGVPEARDYVECLEALERFCTRVREQIRPRRQEAPHGA